MNISPADLKRMDELQLKVKADLEAAEKWMRGITTSDGLLGMVPSWLGGDAVKEFVVTDAQRSQFTAVKLGRELYNRWSTVTRAWAERGTRDDGVDFTVKQWLEIGDANASMLASALGAFWDASIILNGARGTAEATVETAKETAQELKQELGELVDEAKKTLTLSPKAKVALVVIGVPLGLAAVGVAINFIPGIGIVKKVLG